MLTQIGIIVDGTKYYTFFGSEFISTKFPNTNVVQHVDVVRSSAIQSEIKRNNGGRDYRKIPIAEMDVCTRDGSYFIGMGKIMFNEEEYKVSLDKFKLDIEPVNPKPAVELPDTAPDLDPITPEPVPVVVVDPTPEPVVEPEPVAVVPEPEPEPVIESKPEPEPVVEPELEPVPVQQEWTSPKVEEHKLNIELTEKVKSKQPAPEVPNNYYGNRKNKANRFGVSIPRPVEPKKGIQFGKRTDQPETGVTAIGRNEKNKNGIVFGERPQPKRPQRKVAPVNNNSTVLKQQELEAQKAQQVQKEIEEREAEERLQQSWQQPMSPREKFTAMAEPTPVMFTAPPPEPVNNDEPISNADARARAKEAVRKTLDPEVDAIIGDIPAEMLDSITEFTTNLVDVERLNKEKDIFCIDNRWHKQGKWFCIDVVPTASRYFYNSRKNVSIDIPVNVLKAWREALLT